jgi:hypothetical protein
MNECLVEFAEVCNRLDLRFLEDQAVWNNYHAAFCRYRELQADIIRQIKEELDPQTRDAREEAEVDVDQLFDPVCPRCKEPISDGGYRLACNEKTSGIRTGGTTSREIPAELGTFKLSGTVGCASKLRHCLLSSEGSPR